MKSGHPRAFASRGSRAIPSLLPLAAASAYGLISGKVEAFLAVAGEVCLAVLNALELFFGQLRYAAPRLFQIRTATNEHRQCFTADHHSLHPQPPAYQYRNRGFQNSRFDTFPTGQVSPCQSRNFFLDTVSSLGMRVKSAFRSFLSRSLWPRSLSRTTKVQRHPSDRTKVRDKSEWRIAATLVLLATVACGYGRPPNPVPTPTPPPTPEPTPPSQVPPKGQPVLLDLLLRAPNPPALVRGGEPFTPNGFTQCCMQLNVNSRMPRRPARFKVKGTPINSRWPSISILAMDYAHEKAGSNFFSIRVAPYYGDADHESEWADIGGPVSQWPEWNQAWWDENRKFIWHAGSVLKANVQIEWDAWYGKTCKNGSQPCAWPEAEQQAWGEVFTQGHKRFIDKIVEEFGCFGNVVWQVDNEGALVPRARREYYESVFWAFRDAEQRLGCGIVHMGGVNWPEIGDGPFDFVTTHADAALTAPFFGKHSQNNEHNRDYTPEQDHARYCSAQAADLHYWYWRAGSSDEDMETALALRKQGCGGPVGCFPPESDDPLWGQPVPGPGFEKASVQAAQAAVGERCGTDHNGSLATLDALGAELRKRGECAGRLDDAVFVLASDGQWEEYHAVRFTDGCWSQDPAQYPKLRWPYHGTNPVPPGQCTNPEPIPVTRWNVKVHTVGPNWTTVDSTPLVGPDAAYCAAIGFTDGRSICPVRAEGDPKRLTCETEVVGVPVWGGVGEPHPTNVYQRRVPRGTGGTVTVCASQSPNVCGSVEVQP